MKRKFVMMPVFDKQWRDMGLDDNDLTDEERNNIKKMIDKLEQSL